MDGFWDTIMEALKAIAQSEVGALLSFLWTWTLGGLVNLILLGQHAERLKNDMEELREMRDDTMRQVKNKEKEVSYMYRTNQVDGWLRRVDDLRIQVEEFQASFQRRAKCLEDGSIHTLASSFRFGVQVAKRLKGARELKNQRANLGDLVDRRAPPDPIELVEWEPPEMCASTMVHAEAMSIIRCHLEDDNAGVIGIYGMGGVGKTNLLIKLNNELFGKEMRFDVVIYVKVSKDLNILEIQNCVGERLGLFLSANGVDVPLKAEEQAKVLSSALSKMKFLILFDDVWEKLRLEKIGIPRPNNHNKCKIVFTTRLEQVCNEMVSRKVRVGTLDERKSWELFCSNLLADNDFVNCPSVEPLAKVMVSKCGGLPLALTTVGRAMGSEALLDGWRDAKHQLETSTQEFPGIEDIVLSSLKSSFEALENDMMKSCILYFALFPDNHKIDKEDLVECLFGEGLLDGDPNDDEYDEIDIDEARRKGRRVIKDLQSVCLLESGGDTWNEERYVKMQDMVRETAVWLTSGKHDIENFFLHDPKRSRKVLKFKKWVKAKRISLMHSNKRSLPTKLPNCPHLTTLLIDRSYLSHPSEIPYSFFESMPSLRVLNLSNCMIDGAVPKSIRSLSNLQYLNLSGTTITSLPKEMENLKNLRVLDLSSTGKLSKIPKNAISTLRGLQKLDLFKSGYNWSLEPNTGSSNSSLCDLQLGLKDLENLSRLQDLGITIRSSTAHDGLLASSSLVKSTRHLLLEDVSCLTVTKLSTTVEVLKNLKRLILRQCKECKEEWIINDSLFVQNLEYLLIGLPLSGIIVVAGNSQRGNGGNLQVLPPPPLQNLRELHITCRNLKKLVGLGQLPCLECLRVYSSQWMEELVQDGGEIPRGPHKDQPDQDFPNLKLLDLQGLAALKSISRHNLRLPSLQILRVSHCPLLKKLPFGPHSLMKIKEIRGGQEWWDGLEWEHDDIRATLLPYFVLLLE